MKETCKKISKVLKKFFGAGTMVCLYAGGLTFFGYMVALLIGGETATAICTVIYKGIIPYIIKVSTALILVGLVAMYLNGEMALTTGKKKTGENKDKK